MTANEEKILKIIKGLGGKAHLLRIAKEFRISSEYARLILDGLQRKKKIEFQGKWASLPERNSQKRVSARGGKDVPKKKAASLNLKGMTPELQERLQKAGFGTLEALANASISILMLDAGLELKQAANLMNRARRILKIIPDIPRKE